MRRAARSIFQKIFQTSPLQSRNFSLTTTKVLENLKTRALIKVSGEDSSNFLQGLVTNDLRHFENGAVSIYTLFLNVKGRVLFDTIIYKSPQDNAFLLEVDADLSTALEKHLKTYKLRGKIAIEPHPSQIYALFQNPEFPLTLENPLPCAGQNKRKTWKILDRMTVFQDPRLSFLGSRIVAEGALGPEEIRENLGMGRQDSDGSIDYVTLRRKLGVGEGGGDFTWGKSMPLEMNVDYLSGISFHKGCYVGQELTARTFHTGVVRKRLMPLVFEDSRPDWEAGAEEVLDEKGKVVGKLRGEVAGGFGLGLMRVSEALGAESLRIGGRAVKVVKPAWWPQEAPGHDLVTQKQN